MVTLTQAVYIEFVVKPPSSECLHSRMHVRNIAVASRSRVCPDQTSESERLLASYLCVAQL